MTSTSSPSSRSPEASVRRIRSGRFASAVHSHAQQHRHRQPDRDRVEDLRAERPGGQVGRRAQGEGETAAPGHTGTGVCSSVSRTSCAAGQPGRASLGRDDQAVGEHGLGRRLDVVGRDEAAPVRERPRLGHPQQRDPGPRARAEVDPSVAARLAQERDDVAVDALLDEDLAGGRRERAHVGGGGDRPQRLERRVARLLGQHPRLVRQRRVADLDPQREAVELGLGQRVGALVLDRVLGRDHHERRGQLVADAVDGDLVLLHRTRAARPGSSATRG